MAKVRVVKQKPTTKSAIDSIWGTVKSLGLALIMALLVKYSVIEAYNVPTGSMEDTIKIGDFLLANKFIYGIRFPFIDGKLPGLRHPEKGDIVVFKFPGDSSQNYVKRCVAVPGDTVLYREKKLYVNSQLVPDHPFAKYAHPGFDKNRDYFGPWVVPKNFYFMMGDNRDDSYDSRFWGPVHERFILGKALVVHWSWAQDDKAPPFAWLNPLTWPESAYYNILHFNQRVRWDRLGHVLD